MLRTEHFTPGSLLQWARLNASHCSLNFGKESRGLATISKHLFLVKGYSALLGNPIIAHGCGIGMEEATLACIGELVERFVIHASNSPNVSTSNGFAAHTSENKAQQSAVFELYERDAFLCHFLTEVPFLSLSNEIISDKLNYHIASAVSNYTNYGIRLHIGEMCVRGSGRGIVVAFSGEKYIGNSFGLIVSTSYSNNLKAAINKATLSALWDLSIYLGLGEKLSLNLDQFNQLPIHTTNDHEKYALFPDKESWIEGMFKSKPNWLDSKTSKIEISLEKCEIPPFLNNPPLHVYRARSPNLQDLYFGKPGKKDINSRRLEEFSGSSFDISRLEFIPPHFLD